MGHSWAPPIGIGVLALLQIVAAVTVPIVLDSYSSQLDYQPDSVNGPAGTWNASFTGSPWSSRRQGPREPGAVGEGVGYHYTTRQPNQTTDPWVGYTFYGTGIEFFGYFGYLGTGPTDSDEESETELSLSHADHDMVPVTTRGRMTEDSDPTSLGRYTGLALGNYTVQLRVTNGTASFTHFVVDMEVGGK